MAGDPLEGINTFVAVVDAQSFSGAATKLGQSKAAVSLQIRKLENRLGVRLLHRTTRSLSLTDEGGNYLTHCRRILDEAREAHEALDSTQQSPKGVLRVNAPMSFGIQHLGDAVADFMVLHRDLAVDLVLNDQQLDLIDNSFDMAIRIAHLPDSSLISKPITTCRRLIVATPAYWDQHGRPEHPDDLQSHQTFRYEYLEQRDTWLLRERKDTIRVPLLGRLRANNGEVMLAAVRKGLGVDRIPSFFCCEDLRNGTLEAVLQEYEGEPLTIQAVYPHRRHLAARVRVFIDFLIERFADGSPWNEGWADKR